MKGMIALSCILTFAGYAAAASPETLESAQAPAVASAQNVAARIAARTLADCSSVTTVTHGPHTISTRRGVIVKFDGARFTGIVTTQTLQIGHRFPATVRYFNVWESATDRMHRRFVDVHTRGRKFDLKIRVVPVADKIASLTYEVGDHLEHYEMSCR